MKRHRCILQPSLSKVEFFKGQYNRGEYRISDFFFFFNSLFGLKHHQMGVWFTLIFQWEGMYNITNIFVFDRDKYKAIIYINENKFLDER